MTTTRHLPPTADAVAPLIGRRLTRRQTLALLGSGLAGGALLGAVTGDPGRSVDAAQITIEADPANTAPSGRPTIADVAAALQWDTEQIFRFVADQVAYEPYVGALRGAEGALRAMAGNTVDQALLLAALLTEAAVPYRFAVGQLSAEGQAALESQLAPTIEEISERKLRTFRNPTDQPAATATPPALSDDDRATLERLGTTAAGINAAAGDRADGLVTLLSEAIAKAGIDLPDVAATPLPDREQREHIWVQVADGPFWIDLDPSVPNAAQKQSFADAGTTLDSLGPELDHIVRVTVVVEEASGGVAVPRDVVSVERPSRELIDAPIGIGITTPSAFESFGITITNLFEGGETYVPLIVVGDEAASADAPIGFGGNGGGILGGFSGGDDSIDGEALSLSYRLEIISPDADPVTVERMIFDRIDPVQRAAGAIDLTTIESMDGAAGDRVRAAIQAFTMIDVASADVPPPFPLSRRQELFFGSLAYFTASFYSLRNSLGFDWGTRLGWHPILTAPNAIALRFQPEDPEQADTPVLVEADLLHQARGWRQTETLAPAQVSPWIARGVVDQVAERLVLDPSLWMSDAAASGMVPGISAGLVFETAADKKLPIVALDPSAVQPSDLAAYPNAAQVRITAALDAGMWVIVPGEPVVIDGQDALAWWLVDPATGRITDQLADGRSGASATIREPRVFYSDMTEYVEMLGDFIVKWRNAISCFGNVTGFLVGISAWLVYSLGSSATATNTWLSYAGLWAFYFRMVGSCAGV
ncbi:MAG TPA: hypothetical protein VEQ36_16205 [Thermomicrobiales bacterium]|nr:hypothetical protein [Thermomicrobiales bacterium]